MAGPSSVTPPPSPPHPPPLPRLRIVYLDRSACRAVVRPPSFPHEWVEYESSVPSDVIPRLSSAAIAITSRSPIGEEQLAALPHLRLIAVAATGYDCVDVKACRRRGVVVCNIRDWCVSALSQHAFTLILALRRQLLLYREAAWAGAWTLHCYVEPTLPLDLAGSTLGIIGVGALGSRIASIGKAFGMKPLLAERRDAPTPRAGRVPFTDLLRQADVLSLNCPLTEETRGLIGEAELRLMKPTALLIDCSRGGVVDNRALARAVKEGWIAGAGVDVLEEEPPSAGNPLLEMRALNVIVTPHMAWASQQAVQCLADQVIDCVEAFVEGTPQNVVGDTWPIDPALLKRRKEMASGAPQSDQTPLRSHL